MSQRYDIIHINFQANARGANAAIESIRQEAETCNQRVKDLKKQLNDGKKANMPTDQLDKLQNSLDAAQKKARQFNQAYKQLAKGMRTLDEGIKAFNDGSLATMSAAFQKSVYNAAKLTRLKLDPLSKSYTKDKQELTALMGASQKYYATLQADTQQVIDTINKGGKVSRQAITEELQQQKELLSVLSEKDKGYKNTVQQVATLEYELKKMGGSYDYVRKHITDTKKVSDETLRTMHAELQQTNQAGKVSTQIMRENRQAMKEIRAEQTRRVQNVLGGNLGRQSEGNIRTAIANAKELIQIYGTSSKKAKELSAQIVNAEAYLKTVGVEGARAAKQQADAVKEAADKYKLMQDHMKNIGKLTQSALTETQKFWQEQQQGAERGSKKYKEAERNLKALAAEQQRLNEIVLQKSAKNLSRKNLGTMSESELQASITAAKQLAQSMKPGDQAYKDLVDNIIRAEKYVKEFGMEGQRSNRKAAEQMQAMNDNMKNITKLSDGALEETRKFWEAQMNGADRGSKAYNTFKANMDAVIARQRKLVQSQNLASANKLMGGTKALHGMGEGEIRKAITAAREYQQTLKADSNAYTGLSKAIFNAEEYLKQYGIEADKAKMKEEQLKTTMTSRMTSLMTLSNSALAETKKFWQAQMEGAERTSAEYKQAAVNLEKIAQVEQTHKAAWGMRVMAKPGNYGDNEIRRAVKAMEELRDAQAHGSKEWNRYNSLVEQGKKYLQEWAQTDSIIKFEGQMQKLTTLSDSALAETKKFWQEQVDGAAKGSNELKQYQANLDKVKQEEAERRQLSNEMAVQKLGGNLGKLSEGEIRKAIEAGKQLIQTYNTADPAAQKLAQQIVNAEQHLKRYGLEAERSAVREREAVKKAAAERVKANQLMESQLQNSSSLTASALKAQESYWKRLIDDPKTATSSLVQYKANLDKVHLAQKLMMEDAGNKALNFFRNGTGDASAEEVRTQADALKKYRDSLPQQTNANVIREINGYLAQTGQAAQGSAGPMMSLRDAFRMGLQGAANTFKGTPEQLRQAKQVLSETLATTEKGSHRYEQLRRALDGIAIEEKRVGGVTKEMQVVLDQPKGRSFNELKMAVEQGRKALNDMSRATKEQQQAYNKLADKVKAADLELKNVGNTSKGTTSAFKKAVSRLKTYITLYMGTAVMIQKLMVTMSNVMTLSDKMGEVRKTTGFTAEEVGELSDNLAKLDTRTPVQNLMELAAVAGQLGLKTQEDVQGFTEAANMMLVALPEMGQDGATQMMKIAIATGEVKKIQKQMQEGTIEGSSATAVAMEKIASTIDRLRATTAAAAPPIANFVKRVGAVGAQSGISVDQVAALGATVDSLGMGTEMAGTAIARMILAIKNHAFDIAQAIGVTPDTIRNMYETGHAMDVILMILQHIHDQNLNPDGIDKLLGSGGMAEIMKELDQRGARAGIVFAGLSQNVDELRKNLATANSAYQEGTAIMDEYNKMNDTTAGKWARLKNQVQEVFVSDANQRFLGHIIDGLRQIVNLLTGSNGVSASIRSLILFVGALKLELAGVAKGALIAIWNGLKNIGVALGFVKGQMTKLQMANIFTAIAMAVAYFVYELSQLKSASEIANEALGKAHEQIARATDRFEGYWHVLTESDAALRKATASHNKLSAEVNRLRNSTDKSSASTALLTKKEGELKNSEHAVTQATNNRKVAIANINSIYGRYLGFIITERNYALLAASAHDQVTAAIKREMLMKEKQAALSDIDSNYTSQITEDYGKLSDKMSKSGLNRSQVAASRAWLQSWLRENLGHDSNGKTVVKANALRALTKAGLNVQGAGVNEIAALAMNLHLWNTYRTSKWDRSQITGVEFDPTHKKYEKGWSAVYTPFSTNVRGGYASTYVERENERGATGLVFDSDIDYEGGVEQKAFTHNLNGLIKTANNAKRVIYNKKSSRKAVSDAYEDLANALEGLDSYKDNLDPRRDAKTLKQLDTFATSLRKDKRFDATRLKKAQQNLHQTYIDKATEDAGLGGGTGNVGNVTNIPKIDPGATPNNPWGTNADAASTNWSKLTGKQLVERRKQMNDFVKSLQWDTDVESVLSEDPALMKAMKEGKVKKDTDSVIAWYNKQRLAIQDELHSRFLTNTGNWQDPKKAHHHAKSASKMAKDDMSYYLDELDAYYTERKSKIEETQNDGEITEAEGWRRTLDNERIWQQRRAELQQLYANKSSKVTKDEQDAIFNILSERTGDNTGMIEAQIASTLKFIKAIGDKSAPAMRRIFGDLDLGVEQSFLKMRTAVKKQLEAINDIIDKERPFNGIVRNLETNISKMGLLIPDINKKLEALDAAGKSKSKEADALNELAQYQSPKRLTFLLQESENAYQMTWDKFEADLRKNGFGDWADAIVNSGNAERDKEAILAQLRTVYDDVQDAIKKEASEVKKQVDIAWNDTVLPGGVSIKQTYERAANALGVEQGRVSRANSMIGAGTASERVADKLAIKQMEIQLQMQTHYYNLVRKTGEQRVADLKRQEEDARKRGDIDKAEQLALDAKHAKMSLNLTLSEEETDLAKQREDIIARTEESEAKLYSSLKEWGTLLSSSLQGLFEAGNAGAADYYNNLAKMRLTGEGSGGGTYVIIDNAGTKDAKAHYETLDGEDALKRQLEIEQQNAVADEWKKVMDDINKKISDQITDWMNAALQNQAMDANTQQLIKNTESLDKLTDAVNQQSAEKAASVPPIDATLVGPDGVPEAIRRPEDEQDLPRALRKRMGLSVSNDAFDDTHVVDWTPEWQQQQPQQDTGSAFSPMPSFASEQTEYTTPWASYAEASTKATETIVQNNKKQLQSTTDTHKKEKDSAKNTYSAMAAAMNMYGLAYQVMSNENMSSTQKFLTFALQSAGQVAIAMLTTNMLQTDAQSKIELPGILGKAASQLGPIAGPIAFAAMTALLGGLMAVATSKVSKSKSQISQVTGASVSAGRLSTGMLTYAEGNVNEFTDPSTLTPGQQYNVDAADGHTYRARYMGSNPTTHLTNGPEFHLVGERGREAIIDANTTRQLQMNDTGIWNAIQTLYNGGSIRSVRRSGMRNFATGNLDDFADSTGAGMTGAADGATETTDVVSSLQASLDRNSDVLERAMRDGIKGVFDIHGKGGLVDSYDRGKKEANRHGEKY